MAERVRFYFDPLCPWAWQTSKWMREVVQVRAVEAEWRLFSLHLVHARGGDALAELDTRSVMALRTLALIGREADNAGVGRAYQELGRRMHEQGEKQSVATLRAALSDAAFDPDWVERALDDRATLEAILRDHRSAVEDVGAFGVPTLALPSGKGIFGPVVSSAPTGEEAGELWDHVRWLIEKDGFFELKRERDRKPGQL